MNELSKEQMEAFAAVWQDMAKFPSLQSVADACGISRQQAHNRAKRCNAAGIVCESRKLVNNWLVRAAAERAK